jgi:hypothetical protein
MSGSRFRSLDTDNNMKTTTIFVQTTYVCTASIFFCLLKNDMYNEIPLLLPRATFGP